MPGAVSARPACRGCDGSTSQTGAGAGPTGNLAADNSAEAPAHCHANHNHPADYPASHLADCPANHAADGRADDATGETAPGTSRTSVAATGSTHSSAWSDGLTGSRGVDKFAPARDLARR